MWVINDRYKSRLGDAQKHGVKKSMVSGGSMGAMFFIIYIAYALAFWYGAKLVRDEPNNYSGGNILIVSGKLKKFENWIQTNRVNLFFGNRTEFDKYYL